MVVYLIKFPSDKYYVGITENFERRKKAHITNSNSNGRHSQNHIYLAMRKYGIDNLEWTIIDRSDTREDLEKLEKSYIKQYDSFKNGYNMTLGGEGVRGLFFSKETRKKMSDAGKKRIISKETREKISKVKYLLKQLANE